MGQKSGLIRQVPLKRGSIDMIFVIRTRKRGPLNTGDYSIEVTLWAGLTVYTFLYTIHLGAVVTAIAL